MAELTRNIQQADPVAITFPSWVGRGNPAFLGSLCGWTMTESGAGPGIWDVQTVEAATGSRPELVSLNRFGGVRARQTPALYADVAQLAEYDSHHPSDGWDPALALDRQLAATDDPSIFALISSARNLATAAPTAAHLQTVLPSLAEERLRVAVPSSSVWLLRTQDVLGARYALTRALLRETPDAADGPRALTRASAALFPDTNIGLAAYLAPLFACLSPGVWGVTAPRAGGTVVFQFGTILPGENRAARGMLDVLAPDRSSEAALQLGNVSNDELDATLRWWVQRLDLVFGEATNLANYAPRDSVFSPAMMLEKLLNLEQCFRHCQALATTRTDDHTRRLLTFTALESFSGVSRQLDWNKTYAHPTVQGMLDDLERVLPSRVAAVLLPRARRGLEALREVQDGFFDRTRMSGAGVLLTNNSNGRREPVPLPSAARAWLRVLRNSQHGFDKDPSDRDRDLLALHDGRFPPALADLPWLVLVYLMAFPEILRRRRSR